MVSEPPKRPSRPKTRAVAARARRQGEQAQAGAEDGEQGQRHHHQRDREEDEQGVLQRPFEAVDDDRGAGDDVAAALQLEAGRRGPVLGAGLARRRVVDGGFDQLERAVAFGGAEPGLEPDQDLGRVAVGEEVGEARLRGAAGAGEVEDDGGDEFFVVEAGGAGDAVAGGDREQEFTEARGRHPLRQAPQLGVDLDHRLVEEGGRAGDELDRVELRPVRCRGRGSASPPSAPCRRGSPPAAAGGRRWRSGSAAAGPPWPGPRPVLRRRTSRTCWVAR